MHCAQTNATTEFQPDMPQHLMNNSSRSVPPNTSLIPSQAPLPRKLMLNNRLGIALRLCNLRGLPTRRIRIMYSSPLDLCQLR